MESFTENLSPIPYLIGSYGVATAIIVGFAIWLIIERRQLISLKAAIQEKGAGK